MQLAFFRSLGIDWLNNDIELNTIIIICIDICLFVLMCDLYFKTTNRGRVDDLSFFEYLSPFCFLSIEFHCTFSISYKILPYFVYYYCI